MKSMVFGSTEQDRYETALCIWQEARSEGLVGMTAVACVIRNRVLRNRSTFAGEVLRKWAFSAMPAPRHPQWSVLPGAKDPSWVKAQTIAEAVIAGLEDTTGGATLYHEASIGFPKAWDRSKVQFAVQTKRLIFFREI